MWRSLWNSTQQPVEQTGCELLLVRWLKAQQRLDCDKSDKSMKFGTQFAYTLPNNIRRGAQVNLLTIPGGAVGLTENPVAFR